MKKAFFIIVCLFSVTGTFAQIGSGVELQIAQNYQFSPTTTDSTNSVTITVYNTVASEQQITFTGLSEPFHPSDSVLTVAANDSLNFVLSFTPNSPGVFSDVLEFSGNIFGSGALNISGEGVQVSISTSTDILNIGTSAVDEMISSSITIFNTGTGTMEITDITSSNTDFTTSLTSAIISEGSSLELGIEFHTLVSGPSSSIISVHSNDPSSPVYSVFVQASAVSELSGSLCGSLQLINSPFTLTGDIFVPDTCTLTIEPGVVLNAKGYNFSVEGGLDAHGIESDSIYLRGFQHITLENENQSISYLSISDNYEDQVFFDDFEENNFINYFNGDTDYISWSSTYGKNNVSSGIKMYNNENNYDIEVYTNPFEITSDLCVVNFDHYFDAYSSGNAKVYYKINDENWILLETFYSSSSANGYWTSKTYDLTEYVSLGDDIQIKFINYS